MVPGGVTYTSNAIEGNTLSRVETALVVNEELTVAGKSIREHQEAINLVRAWELEKEKSTRRDFELLEMVRNGD